MSTQLWLQEPRTVLDEPGAAWHYDFGEQSSDLRERLRRGELMLTNALWEPVGGVILGQPDFALRDTTHADWLAEGVAWERAGYEPEALSSPLRRQWRRGMAYAAATGAWSLSSREPIAQGQSHLVQFLAYASDLGGPRLTLEFGGVWRAELANDGSALVYRRRGDDWQRQGWFRWLGQPSVAGWRHTLWIYELGAKLIIRSLDTPLADGSAGLALWDDEPEEDSAGRDCRHALHRGTWQLSGNGRALVGCSALTSLENDVSIELAEPEPVGSYLGITQPLQTRAWGWSAEPSVRPTVTAFDGDGSVYPIWPAMPTSAPADRLRWRAQWHNTADAQYALAALALAAPATIRTDGSEGTDLLSLPGVSDRGIALTREGDPLRERLTADLTASGDLAAYCQANMAVRYVAGGLTRFRGLTDSAQWQVEAHADPVLGQLSLHAVGLDKRFDKASWPGGRPFDGRRLTDCLVELAQAAGLAPDGYAIVDDPFCLPDPPAGQGPTLAYRAGTSVASILDDLRRSYFGDWLTAYWEVSDGRWVVDYTAGAGSAPVTSFHTTDAAARAAGVPGQVILAGSYREVLDESKLANVVTVIGQAPDGEPLTARCVDWASIRSRGAINYVGEVWPLVVADAALTTRGAVNYVCRSRFEQVRWPRVLAEFRSVRVDLRPGDVVQLVGEGYGACYRVRGVHLEQAAEGDAAGPEGRAAYSLEKLR